VEALRPHDFVEFVGPPGPVLKWPKPGERGVVDRLGHETVHVIWEHSPLVVAWPIEWVERREEQMPAAP